MALKKRSDKLAFYGVPSGNITRMSGFTALSKSQNPKEYTRQYVDEESEQTDITAYSPSIEYTFDHYTDNAVHNDIAMISDDGKTGTDAVRYIYEVDKTKASGGGYLAYKRPYSVIPDAEGDSMDAYTYSGSFKSKGAAVVGVATSSDDFQTITFTPDSGAEYLVTFNVSSAGGQVANAQIVINSTILTTDANGFVEIMLPAATYAYTVSKALYTTVTDSVTVSTAAVLEAVTLVLA